MTNTRSQATVTAEHEIAFEAIPRTSLRTSQMECCGCPACPCGCQYGLPSGKASAGK